MNDQCCFTSGARRIARAVFTIAIILATGVLFAGCKPIAPYKSPKVVNSSKGLSANKLINLAKTDQIALLQQCLDNYNAKYHDYTGVFYRQERLRGKLSNRHKIAAKYKEDPFSVVLTWQSPPPPADIIIYIEGKNDGNLLARPAVAWQRLLVGTQKRKPTHKEVLAHALHPITMFGFRKGLENLLKVYKLAKKNGDLVTEYRGKAIIDSRETLIIARILPPNRNYPTALTVIYIDLKYLVPVCVREYSWDKKLHAHYEFRQIKFNTSLTDKDFLPENNDM